MCLVDGIKHDGLSGFYRGVLPPLFTTSLVKSCAFTVYERSKPFFQNILSPGTSIIGTSGEYGLNACFMAGSTGGLVISVVSAPMELIKTHMQISNLKARELTPASSNSFYRPVHQFSMVGTGSPQALWMNLNYHPSTRYPIEPSSSLTRPFTSSLDCVSHLIRQQGLGILYRGFLPQMARESLGFGTYFMSFEALCRWASPTGRKENTGGATHFLAGGLSGIVIWMVIFPLDLVKARMHSTNDMGVWDCVRRVYAEGGVRGFYKGIGPSLLRAFPAHATIFLVYEFCMQHLRHAETSSNQ